MDFLIGIVIAVLFLMLWYAFVFLLVPAIRAHRARRLRREWESIDRQAEWHQAARKTAYPDATTTLSPYPEWRLRPVAYMVPTLPPEVPGAD